MTKPNNLVKEFDSYDEARNYAWDNGLTIDRITQTLFGTVEVTFTALEQSAEAPKRKTIEAVSKKSYAYNTLRKEKLYGTYYVIALSYKEVLGNKGKYPYYASYNYAKNILKTKRSEYMSVLKITVDDEYLK